MKKKKGWHANWDSTFDLSRGGRELDYKKNVDMIYLLVETRAIQTVKKIILNIKNENISPRYHISGDRGLGKSTILNYLSYDLYKNINNFKVLPVYAVLDKSSDEQSTLEIIFFRSLLKHLFNVVDDIKILNKKHIYQDAMNHLEKAKIEYFEILKDKGDVKFDFVYSGFENQLKHMNKYFDKIVFLIDGLDKQPTEEVLKFKRDNQEKINYLIGKYNCIFFDAADPTWRKTLDMKEYSGIRGKTIFIRPWSSSEIKSLIEKRLERIGVYDNPITTEAIETIVEDHNGNTRLILQYITNLLDYAYRERIHKIGKGLARDIIWKEGSKDMFQNKITMEKTFRYAYLKLKEFISDRQSLNILIAIYDSNKKRISINIDYDTRTSYGITLDNNKYITIINRLENRGCIIKTKMLEYYELDNDIMALFKYAEELEENIIALPVILQELESIILENDLTEIGQIFLKDEIRQAFTKNYNTWMNYNNIKSNLFYNPRTLKLIENQYGEDYEKIIDIQIPLIVGQLKSEHKIMFDENISEFKWKPTHLDDDIVDFFKDKIILNMFDEIYVNHQNRKYGIVNKKSKEIINLLLNNLCSLINKNINELNNQEIITTLNYLEVDTKSYISIKDYLSMLKKKPKNKTESDLLIYNTLLYSKRIYNKINEITKYNIENNKILKLINDSKTGNSYINERKIFNTSFLDPLLKEYGKVINLLSTLKLQRGYVIKKPDVIKLFNKDVIIKGTIYKCPDCDEKHIVKGNKIDIVLCNNHLKECILESEIYFLNPKYYQSWNVWMEEYTLNIINNIPFYYAESGLYLQTIDKVNLTRTQEIDIGIIHKGIGIAIECTELLTLNNKNTIDEIIEKINTLGFFKAIILIYKEVDNENMLINYLKKYQNIIYAIQVKSPAKFEKEIFKIITKISTN